MTTNNYATANLAEKLFNYSETQVEKPEFPLIEVTLTEHYPVYNLMYPEKYSLLVEDGFSYIPLRYDIFSEADESFDEVGEMTFLHIETGQEVESPLYTTDFENDSSLYVCLKSCDCLGDDEECQCADVTFLMDFNDLKIPFKKHLDEQKLTVSV